MAASGNIFVAPSASADAIPANIARRSNHPVPREGIVNPSNGPIQTNKFYANFFLSGQHQSTFTFPYSIQWSKGSGSLGSWGMSISHIDRDQLAFGPQGQNPPQYYINPVGIQSLIFSAQELDASTTLTSSNLTAFSASIQLNSGGNPLITFPITQGMGFITAIYNTACTPVIQSGVLFRQIAGPTVVGSKSRYVITLEDGKQWLMYVIPTLGYSSGNFTLSGSNNALTGPAGFTGAVQIAKNPAGTNGMTIYDQSAGAWPVSATLTGTVNGDQGSYTLSWQKQGGSNPLLMFALPHHVQSFDAVTASARTTIQLNTTVKGTATAVIGDSWTMQETLPTDMQFAPWSPSRGNVTTLSAAAQQQINSIAALELNQDFNAQTNLSSMYFSGKGLAKFAFIVFTAHDIAHNASLATAGLMKLKNAFAVFVNNQQTYPLVYDDSWKGVVSTAGYNDSGADFGNTYYNDHHFHYGRSLFSKKKKKTFYGLI